LDSFLLFELTIQELSCPNAVTDDSGSLQSQKKGESPEGELMYNQS
jgi:hypothetical protein